MWISLVSKEGATYLRTVVLHTNVSLPQLLSCTRAVAFAGHSMAATSIFTPVFLISKVFILGGSNVTRVPEMENENRMEKVRTEGRSELAAKLIKGTFSFRPSPS
jgi:hypothetical protein